MTNKLINMGKIIQFNKNNFNKKIKIMPNLRKNVSISMGDLKINKNKQHKCFEFKVVQKKKCLKRYRDKKS